MRILFLPVLAICFCLLTAASHAQFASPTDVAPVAPALQFGKVNAQLKNTLALQAQLQALRSLIDHEKAVNEMVSAAVAIGITDPVIPSPNRDICLSVPANIPCAQAYAALYDHYSVVKEKPQPVFAPVIAKMDKVIDKIVAKVKPQKPVEPEMVFAALYWTNITCLNGNCSAVVSGDPKDPKASYRITAGEKLPDGSVINGISAAGVTIMRNKKVVTIDPAPKA
jgi:hypothetical protein